MSVENKAKRVAESKSVMTEMVMPNDANPMGNLMGGNLLRWMDIISSICAGKHCENQVVTVSVDNVAFKKPIHVGDIVTIEAMVTRSFNTSVEVYVEVYAADIKGHNYRRCNHAYYTFVALSTPEGKPISVPTVIPLTDNENKLFDSAPQRREMRLLLGGR
jgi:acyl-CoA hydrolase